MAPRRSTTRAGGAARRRRRSRFDAAIVDLDTRARDGGSLIAHLRAHAAGSSRSSRCCRAAGCPRRGATPLYHLAIEKPARLAALLSAVNVAHAAIRN